MYNRHNFAVVKFKQFKTMRLQKLLLIAAMLLSAFAASAQLHTSIRVGATATTLGEQEIKLGMRAGASVEYQLSNLWGVRSGLFYTMKGATISKDVLCYKRQETTKLSYLDIPFEAQISIGLSPKTRLTVHAGPYLAYMVHSSMPTSAQYKLNRMEVGAGLGVDLSIGRFVLTPEVQYGLTKVTKPDSNHNISYALTLGYRF